MMACIKQENKLGEFIQHNIDRGDSHSEDNKIPTIQNYKPSNICASTADNFVCIEQDICNRLCDISMPAVVKYAYCPLYYAFETHCNFLQRFCKSKKDILFLGMNPGPFGMSQNGVPFGEVSAVRDWMQIRGTVYKPFREHPKRVVDGLQCHRKEVSGARFWGFFRDLLETPERFFDACFIMNHCPFSFMTDTGKNITPPQLHSATMKQINAVCDQGLIDTVKLLDTKVIVCIGKYARDCAERTFAGRLHESLKLVTIMHPSPINPAANRGWSEIVKKQLTHAGVLQRLTQC